MNLLDLPVLAELPLQLLLPGGEVEAKHPKAGARLGVLPVAPHPGGPRVGAVGPRPGPGQ